MRGFEVVTGLTSISKFLEQFNAKSLYEEEWAKSYKEYLRVAMSVVATEGSNELGGFYEGNPLIKTIERALEISLVSWQKDYVLHKSNTVPKTRGCGKTLAYQLRMITDPSLSLNLSDPQDLKRMNDHPCVVGILIDEFLRIHKKLADAGIPVCTIIRK